MLASEGYIREELEVPFVDREHKCLAWVTYSFTMKRITVEFPSPVLNNLILSFTCRGRRIFDLNLKHHRDYNEANIPFFTPWVVLQDDSFKLLLREKRSRSRPVRGRITIYGAAFDQLTLPGI